MSSALLRAACSCWFRCLVKHSKTYEKMRSWIGRNWHEASVSKPGIFSAAAKLSIKAKYWSTNTVLASFPLNTLGYETYQSYSMINNAGNPAIFVLSCRESAQELAQESAQESTQQDERHEKSIICATSAKNASFRSTYRLQRVVLGANKVTISNSIQRCDLRRLETVTTKLYLSGSVSLKRGSKSHDRPAISAEAHIRLS